jgi:secreted Zn-dependent insulinase-like peptidase
LEKFEEMSFEKFVSLLGAYRVLVEDAEALVLGNVSAGDATSHVHAFVKTLYPKFNARQPFDLVSRSTLLREREASIFVERVIDPNYAIVNYIQTGFDSSARDRAMLLMIDTSLGNLPFQVLRTQQALGYAVGMERRYDGAVLGISIFVQSPKFEPQELEQKITQMIETRFSEYIDRLDNETFESVKSTCNQLLMVRNEKLSDEFESYWRQIVRKEYNFTRRKTTMAELSNTTIDQFKEYVRDRVIMKRKSVSIHAWPLTASNNGTYDVPTYNDHLEFKADHILVQ